jgi:uncharacterized protein (TIGR00369 family)
VRDLSSFEYVGGFAPRGFDNHVDALMSQLTLHRPPLHHHGGLTLEEASPGSATFRLPVGPRWRRRDGAVAPAATLFLCDAPLGTAVLSALPIDRVSPTAELSVFYLSPIPRETTELRTTAHLVHEDGVTGFSEADIVADDGTVVAKSVTRIAITPVPPIELPPTRPVPDDFVPHHLREEGLDGPEHPYMVLHGMEEVAVNPSIAILRMVTNAWHLSPSANLYGGTCAVFAQAAADALAEAAAPEGMVAIPLDLKVQYPRPIGPGETLVCEARTVHAGRRIFFGEVFVRRDDGKVVTLGTSTHRFE